MHFLFMTRGVKQQRDIFVDFMTTQMFPWKRINLKTGKEEIVLVQGALRPVELWDYVFPEEHLQEVLTMTMPHWSLGKKADLMRRLIDKEFSPVPKFDLHKAPRFIPTMGMAIYPVGIKKDLVEENQTWGYKQEML